MQEKSEGVVKRMEALEYHAWKCLENAENNRERLAAVKTISDLLAAQMRLDKNEKETEVDNAGLYEEQLQNLVERVRQLASRRGGGGQDKGAR